MIRNEPTEAATTSQAADDKEIARNLTVAGWLKRWEPTGGRQRHEVTNPTETANLSEDEIDRLCAMLDGDDQPAAGKEAAQLLADHAAGYIRQHFPEARYANNEGHTEIPTLSAIVGLAEHWVPTLRRKDATRLAGPIRGTSARSTAGRRETMSEEETLRLHGVRMQAAERFRQQARETGAMPSSPSIAGGMDADQEAVREGWFDAAADFDETAGNLRLDPAQGPVRATWKADGDPVTRAGEKIAKDETKRTATATPDQLAILAGMRASKEAYQSNGARADRPRHAIEAAHVKAENAVGQADAADEQGTKTSEQVTLALKLCLRIGRTADIDVADRIERECRPLGNAAGRLLAGRKERAAHGTGPKSAARDRRAMSNLRKAGGRVTKLAGEMQPRSEDTVTTAWNEVIQCVEDALSHAQQYRLPERESMWESDEREQLARASANEIRAQAVWTETETRTGGRVEILLVPDRWVVEITRQDGEERIVIGEDIDTVAGSIAEIMKDLEMRRDAVTSLIERMKAGETNWTEETDPGQRAAEMDEGMRTCMRDEAWETTISEPLCTMAGQLRDEEFRKSLTERALRRALDGTEEVFRWIAAESWSRAWTTADELVSVGEPKGSSKQAQGRRAIASTYRESATRLRAELETRQRIERENARTRPALRLKLPDEKAKQLALMG